MSRRMTIKLNVEFVMLKAFQLVMLHRQIRYLRSWCYFDFLICNVDDELGDESGSGTNYTCENTNCNRAFHSVCLGDWLRSITTTRQYVEFLLELWYRYFTNFDLIYCVFTLHTRDKFILQLSSISGKITWELFSFSVCAADSFAFKTLFRGVGGCHLSRSPPIYV